MTASNTILDRKDFLHEQLLGLEKLFRRKKVGFGGPKTFLKRCNNTAQGLMYAANSIVLGVMDKTAFLLNKINKYLTQEKLSS